MTHLVAPLFDGPLDIIGDVHGEIDMLARLLDRLGYDEEGYSPEGRRLVFLGDLIDRGPDSPAVVDKVMALMDAGRAQCLMGNHEILALLGWPLSGNGWILGASKVENIGEFPSKEATPAQKEKYLDFFAALPLVLENDHLRLVHACWHGPSVDSLRGDMGRDGDSITALFEHHKAQVEEKIKQMGLWQQMETEQKKYKVALEDPDWPVRPLPAHGNVDLLRQNENPLRILTAGEIGLAERPFFALGKWRLIDRVKWWDDYGDEIPVIIGHFWRKFNTAAARMPGLFGKDIFEGIASHAWLGKRKNVYCVDYSVGLLYKERKTKAAHEFHGKLAALRYPEWEVHHDDGTVIAVGPPGQ